jgi:hypothetical protein
MLLRPPALVVPVLAAALSACSSITPIRVSLPKGESYTGTAWTNLYTGTLSAGPCQGSFNGSLAGPEVMLAMNCGARRGTGAGVRDGSTFVRGTVALNNGGIATIAQSGPTPTYYLIPPLPSSDERRKAAAEAPDEPTIDARTSEILPTLTPGVLPGSR